MYKRYDRGSQTSHALFEVGGSPREYDLNWLCGILGITNIVRIRQLDMPENLSPGQSYIHFGLPVHDHFQGERVLIAPIVDHGLFAQGEEKLPLLSFAGAMIAKITELHPELGYDQVNSLWFRRKSVANIRSEPDISSNLVARYQNVLRLSEEEIKRKGFSVRKLKVVRHLTSAEKTRLEC